MRPNDVVLWKNFAELWRTRQLGVLVALINQIMVFVCAFFVHSSGGAVPAQGVAITGSIAMLDMFAASAKSVHLPLIPPYLKRLLYIAIVVNALAIVHWSSWGCIYCSPILEIHSYSLIFAIQLTVIYTPPRARALSVHSVRGKSGCPRD